MWILKHPHGICGYQFLDIGHVYLDRGLITSIRFCFHQKPPKRDSLALSAKSRPACIVWRRPLH